MPYKELRSEYSLTSTVNGFEGNKTFIDHPVGGQGGCVVASLPVIGDAFDLDHETCTVKTITKTAYSYNHATTEDGYKYVCTYSTEPDPNRYADQWYNTRYTGGGQEITYNIKKEGSEWAWVEEIGNTVRNGIVGSNSLSVKVMTGTYTTTVILPNKVDAARVGDTRTTWGNFLTGNGSTTYGINNSLGKINTEEMKISPIESDASSKWKSGTLMFHSYDAYPIIDEWGLPSWVCNLNFNYKIIDLSYGGAVTNKNVDYSWLYALNTQSKPDKFQWQIPARKDPDGTFPEDGVYVYNFADFLTTLDITP